MRVLVVKGRAVVAETIGCCCRTAAAAAAAGETAHFLFTAEGIHHRSFSSTPPPPPRPHVVGSSSSSSSSSLWAGDHSDRWHGIGGEVQRKREYEGHVGGGGAMATPRFKEEDLGLRVISLGKCSRHLVHAPRSAWFMLHAPSRRSFSTSASSSPCTSPPAPPETSPPNTSTPAPPVPDVPENSSPPDYDLCSDRCSLGDMLEASYDPVEFVRNFPAVMFSKPKNAPDTLYDRWVFEGWFQSAIRDILSKLEDHHIAGLEFEDINTETMTIACNIDSSEFYPRFNFHGKTRNITFEGQKRNYTQLGSTLEKLIAISASASNVHAYHHQLLTEDAKDLLNKMRHPSLDRFEVYMLRNHPSLLQIEAHASFYLTCFDHLKLLPKTPVKNFFKELPYAVGDQHGHWIAIAHQHPLLSMQLSHGYGISNWSQATYRRDGYCHRTEPGSKYSIVQTHRIYHQYFPRTLPAMMWGMVALRQHKGQRTVDVRFTLNSPVPVFFDKDKVRVDVPLTQ
ncbi:hypothetical protein OsI_05845 [Oryza sativa Indica Group]|uniref:Uncharacterized protein n=1 Tax=Oryza sativa subsp. indica TaxID=39946 RepID=B8AHR3_ORYSI|nr:hypothetical protein OsI_05845 [Oryza sativa Indica Group]